MSLLLRGSDFCRPRRRRRDISRRGGGGGAAANIGDDADAEQQHDDDNDDDGFVVQLEPLFHHEESITKDGGDCLMMMVAYTSSTNVLRQLHITSGKIVWLTIESSASSSGIRSEHHQEQQQQQQHFQQESSSTRNNRTTPKIAVRLLYIQSTQSPQASSQSENNDELSSLSLQLPVISMSPLVAVNLGISIDLDLLQQQQQQHFRSSSRKIVIKAKLDPCWDTVVIAGHHEVKLRYWGRPIIISNGSRDNDDDRGEGYKEQEEEEQEETKGKKKKKPSGGNQQWPLPPVGCILQKGCLTQVVDEETNEIYTYEIVDISIAPPATTDEENGTSSSTNNSNKSRAAVAVSRRRKGTTTIVVASLGTRYTLVAPPFPCVAPQLPPLLSNISNNNNNNNNSNRSTKSSPSWRCCCFPKPNSLLPHPDLPQLIHALGMPSSTPASCVLSVIGTDNDHDISRAVEYASNLIGRRYLSVRCGWTVFAYLQQSSTTASSTSLSPGGDSNSNSNITITNGGLADKLLGLELAMKNAHEHSPSVLHLNLDRELTTSSDHDKHDRIDQEGRIISLLLENLVVSAAAPYHRKQISPLLVVLSTRHPLLPDGPIRQRLVRPALQASLPKDDYISYLCHENSLKSSTSGGGIDDDEGREKDSPSQNVFAWDEDFLPLLRGRPAKEVVQLWEECQDMALTNNDADNNNQSLKTTLQNCCQQRDRTRRNLQSAHIPVVHWSDVGGLDHVRAELLDALELPLHYSHLLPGNSGRGMLLWGPPGTGKTLVAKAIATECNLPFISIKGPELLGSYVGESEKNVRQVFSKARQIALKNTPLPASVLFFDELDSLAPKRGHQSSGGNVMDRVVATLFAELDEKSDDCSVYVMGATNRPDLLDVALLRPGRFDRLIYLGVPNNGNEQVRILKTHFSKLRLEAVEGDDAAQILAEKVVQHLDGCCLTGADLSTIASSALLTATERLCQEADRELLELQKNQTGSQQTVTIDQVLESWDDDRLEPIVTLKDLLEASASVVPSVSAEELDHYVQLNKQFQAMT